MSVIRSKRSVAFSEFERQTINLCKYTKDRLNKVPARYKKYLCPPVYDPVNRAVAAVVYANEQRNTDEGQRRRKRYLASAVRSLQSLQKPLYVVWNLLDITEESCANWANEVNRVFALIWGVTRWKDAMPMIVPLPKRKMQELEFLKVLGELHRYTYQKIGHAPQYCYDTVSVQIAGFVNTALCEVVVANHRMPSTTAEAEERAGHLRNAIDALNALQRPLLALWLLQDYSEREMNEWASLIDTEVKLLFGLLKADKERFKNLS